MALTFRLAAESEADACNDFQTRLTKNQRSREQWLWQYAPQRPGDAVLYALALDGDTIVASQALIRTPMRGPQGAIATAKGEDTAIAPRYWGKNILGPLYDVLADQAAREGIQFLWGFNSARPVFEKVGFDYLPGVSASWLIRPLSARGLTQMAQRNRHGKQRAKHKVTWRHRLASNPLIASMATTALAARATVGAVSTRLCGRGVAVRALPDIPEDLEALTTRFVERHRTIAIDRSPAFMRWRLTANPYVRSSLLGAFEGGQLIGFASCGVSASGLGTITDLIVLASDPAIEGAATFELLAGAATTMRKLGGDVARMPIFNRHPMAETTVAAAGKAGFLPFPVTIGFCVRPLPGFSLDENWRHADRWYFTNLHAEGRDG
jgi:hypothetical protein